MNVGARGEKCLQRSRNVSSNPSPTMATCHKALRISLSTFISSLKFSLFS